jgi:hypothetical protein
MTSTMALPPPFNYRKESPSEEEEEISLKACLVLLRSFLSKNRLWVSVGAVRAIDARMQVSQEAPSWLDVTLRASLLLCICVCLVCYVAECSEYRPKRKTRYSERTERRANPHLHLSMKLPILAWWLCSILGFVQVFVKPGVTTTQQGCTARFEINPDIGGVGVRYALVATMAITCIPLALGACGYCGETGAKELGVASLVSKSVPISSQTCREVCVKE